MHPANYQQLQSNHDYHIYYGDFPHCVKAAALETKASVSSFVPVCVRTLWAWTIWLAKETKGGKKSAL